MDSLCKYSESLHFFVCFETKLAVHRPHACKAHETVATDEHVAEYCLDVQL